MRPLGWSMLASGWNFKKSVDKKLPLIVWNKKMQKKNFILKICYPLGRYFVLVTKHRKMAKNHIFPLNSKFDSRSYSAQGSFFLFSGLQNNMGEVNGQYKQV